MLNSWISHDSYCSFISQGISSLPPSDLLRLSGSFSDSLDKLTSLNLDPIRDHLIPYYSNTGRPALYQPQILKSFLLMVDSKEVSIKNWVRKLHSDSLLAFLIGCAPGSVPSLTSHYDFIDRLWMRDKEIQKRERLKKHKYNFLKKPKKGKLKKGEKLPPKSTGSVKKMVDFFLSGRSLDKRFDKLLQEIFVLAAIVPSLELGLLPHNSLTASGDGTCLPVPSSHYGIKDCNCHDNGIWACKCDRRYSNPDADGAGTAARSNGSMATPFICFLLIIRTTMWICLSIFALLAQTDTTVSPVWLPWLSFANFVRISQSKTSLLTQLMTTTRLIICVVNGR